MNKPIIGIIGKKLKQDKPSLFENTVIGYDNINALDKSEATYIGLITNDKYDDIDEKVLSLCDGILFPGGVDIEDYHFKIIEYSYEHKIPFLGICLGCQALGITYFKENELSIIDDVNKERVINHWPVLDTRDDVSKVVHNVTLKQGSILYNLFGDNIQVNSRHKYCLNGINEPLEIVGRSDDGIIEAIELIDKNQFMVGVQWHPENMESMKPLFEEFIKQANNRKTL